MSYVALARKWRPRTFSQLVGQDHINKVLTSSLTQQRLHHAYLFTGTRGVGKTSIARIMAKALNCERGITAEPCLECDACLAIEQGRFIDLIEIDGASKTRVEDTREVLENVQYAPTNARFKIYLIDEVHMLSQHSFNALLKTLEEPPAHVKFFLATTDPQKLPITVLSRCLHFNLKHVESDVIAKHLKKIVEDEQLPYEEEAIDVLSRAARGSVRDALSLLDQAIAGCDKKLRAEEVKDVLGVTQQDYALQLLEALAFLNPEALMNISHQIASEGGNFHYVIDEMLSHLHQINIHQLMPTPSSLMKPTANIRSLSPRFSPEDVQLFYQIGIKGAEEINLAPTLSVGFEMMLLRMYAFRPAPVAPSPQLMHQENTTTSLELPLSHDNLVEKMPQPSQEHVVDTPTKPITPYTQPEVTHDKSVETEDWGMMVKHLKLTGLALSAAENAELINRSDSGVTLRIAKGHRSLFTPSVITRIEQRLANYYKSVVKLTLSSDEAVLSSPAQQQQKINHETHEDAVTALKNDPFFQQLQQEFSAELVGNSIASLKEK
jgi:DNA polymerase-3 subunit gamma/tau